MTSNTPHTIHTLVHAVMQDSTKAPSLVAEAMAGDAVARQQWLLEWRREYASLTHTIRAKKQERRVGSDEDRSQAQYFCWMLAKMARAFMEVRTAHTEIVRSRRQQAA